MPLVTYADLHKPAATQPMLKVFELSKLRLHDNTRRMPPTAAMSATDLAALDQWFDAGARPGVSADATCALTPAKPTGSTRDRTYGRLDPLPGETCYEFKTHAAYDSVDSKAYDVGSGEHYEQFYFKAPWPAGTVATSYSTITDNAKVLHHWLLFSTDENEVQGFHKTSPLPTLAGQNPQLLAGWAVGGPNVVPPEDVGLELPGPGKQINVQWHFYNSTDERQVDASSLQICTVPATMRAHVGNVTWLGTEDLNGSVFLGGAGMPPRQESTFTASCSPGRKGLGADEPIHIIGFEPHMHRIGTRMRTDVVHKDKTVETIFDEPFSFGNETHYFRSYDLLPGETLTTSCSFNNTNDYGVPFGESTDAEMCYQFVFAWPTHALANFAPSWIGVPDTCW
jgi:hypothetical protein